MDLAAKDPSPSLAAAPADARLTGLKTRFGLSWRLLVLTVIFVMLAEVLFLAPSLARFRVNYLEEKIDAAHLIISALEAVPGQPPTGRIDPTLRDRLLDQAGMLGLTILRPNTPPRTLGPRMPPRIPKLSDLREDTPLTLVIDTLHTMFTKEPTVMGVTGLSQADPRVVVEVVLEEAPLAQGLWNYLRRILTLSLFISVTAAALVYATVQWLAVRPLQRLTANMTGFQQDPEDPRRVITPEARSDEVGTAEQALADMQMRLRASLLEKERLAGLGAAVTKISHDLKNILATAQLESDRLENAPNIDPDVKVITSGIVRAIDRAVRLSTSTIRFAKEELPAARKQKVSLREILTDAQMSLQPVFPGTRMIVDLPEDVTFMADAELMHRVFENLLRNAGEASAKSVRLSYMRDGKDGIVLVADDGPGMAKRATDHLFVPFAGSAKSGGTGLGLPIAREALRVQGGDIVLNSTSPAGTVFAVRLPVT
ncbi:MAG: HAMP domain-containing histidine kinase [Rhodospirillaceae bacterium]|nr:HAMP domain-containing histidine kinase [Rhodospirillaceae bacterium]